jgi:hypothetical protein
MPSYLWLPTFAIASIFLCDVWICLLHLFDELASLKFFSQTRLALYDNLKNGALLIQDAAEHFLITPLVLPSTGTFLRTPWSSISFKGPCIPI